MLLRRLVTLTSIFDELRDEFHAHLTGDAATAEPVLIAELVDIRNRQAVIDGHTTATSSPTGPTAPPHRAPHQSS
jgi:hypothetical protein